METPSTIGFLIVTGAGWLGFLNYANSMLKMVNGKQDKLEKNMVTRPECHIAQDSVKKEVQGIHKRIDSLEKNTGKRLDDMNTRITDGFNGLRDLINAR